MDKASLLKDLVPGEHLSRPFTRGELLALAFRLTLFGAITYYTLRWTLDALDPTRKQKLEAQKQAESLLKQVGVQGVRLSEYEMNIAAHIVDPKSIKASWADVAGLDEVISDLKDNVILPFHKHRLFPASQLLQPPRGVLLHGPPGCGKTLLAKATAREAECRFINLQPSVLTDKWYGESQKLTAAVFSLAQKIRPTIIFIDEIDSFLRSRSSSDHEATAMMKAQFMSLWDGLQTDQESNEVMVMGASNRPQDIDGAILRRMPTRLHVGLPNEKQRLEILRLILKTEELDEDVDEREFADVSGGFSGSDLRELCRHAAIARVRPAIDAGDETLRPIARKDFLFALQKMGKMSADIHLD